MALLSDAQIELRLEGSEWRRDGEAIVRDFDLADFVAAIELVQRVADLAEAANHHPDIDIRWNTVTLHLSTHSAGGLTQGDLDMARAIDGLAAGG